MKPRFFKILIPAAIVGLAVFSLTSRLAPQASSSPDKAAPARSKARTLTREELGASAEDQKRPDFVLRQIPEADRGVLWDGIPWSGKSPVGMISKNVGDTVTLDLGAGEPIVGKVILKAEEGGTSNVGVSFGKPAATLHLRSEADGSLFADLSPAGSLSVYRWTGKGDSLVFTRVPKANVVCGAVDDSEEFVAGKPKARTTMPAPAAPPQAVPPPLLNSRVGGKGCIYLDFDGETVTGTRWNTEFLTPSIVAASPNYTVAQMTAIWKVVAEDYAPFSINVTTDLAVYNTYAKNRRKRAIFTPTDEWLGISVGGIAYLESFNDGSDYPCWVISTGVGDEFGAGGTASHEVGHTLGLRHDGEFGAEYYTQGNGNWAPIMGGAYGIAPEQWSNGDYTGSTNTEDDLAIIASAKNGAGFVTDDYGNSAATATTLGKNTLGLVSQSGLISTTADVDYFAFTSSGGTCKLDITLPSNSPNLNAAISLYDSTGALLATSNPFGSQVCSINQVIPAGSYTLKIEGAAEATYDTGGYSEYGSVGPYVLSGSIPGLGAGIATILEPSLDAVSIREGNGLFLNATAPGATTGSTVLWKQASGPVGGTTTFSSPTTFATRASFSKTGLYTLQVQLTTSTGVSTDTLTVSVESITDLRAYSNLGPVVSVSSPTSFFCYDADLIGSATDDGVPSFASPKVRWELISGAATIATPQSSGTPIHFLAPGACSVLLSASDGQIRTFKEQSLNVSVRTFGAAVVGTPSKLLIPTNSSVDATWRDLAFDDSAWASKPLAIGYGTATPFKAALVGGSNIRTQLYNRSSSTYTRVPFQIRSKDFVGGLKLQMRFDDGFVMYLNGTEILRNNVPAGPPAWNTVATTNRLAADVAVPINVDLSAYKSLLLNGANVLAIHGVNYKKADSEFLIAPSFEVQLIDTPYYRNLVEASALPAAVLAPSADADSDGTSNLVEHALGLNPFTFNAAVPILTPDGAGAVKMTLPLSPPADVQYILERSYDMVIWTPIAQKNGAGAWSSSVVTVSTVSIASPQTTIRLQEASAPPSAVYRIRFVLSGPP